MLARLAIISVTAMATIGAAAPEHVKPSVSPQSASHSVTILASADQAGPPMQPAEAPKKPRAMRVTTCRCADQVTEPDGEAKDR